MEASGTAFPDTTKYNWVNGRFVDLTKINKNDDNTYISVVDFDFDSATDTELNASYSFKGSTYKDVEIDLSHFDASQIKDLDSLCRGGTNLLSVNFGENFNTSNCNQFYSMFYNCSKLTRIDISMFDMSKCTDLSHKTSVMFSGCSSLVEVKLNKAKLYSISNVFANCSSLTSLDLSPWDISEVSFADTSSCLKGCSNLTEIKFGGMPPTKLYPDFFEGMPTNGTLYIPSQYKIEWMDVLQDYLTEWERIEY